MAGLFIKLDVNFFENPKVLEAGEKAAWLYLQMLAYSKANLTDGFVPDQQLARFALRSCTNRVRLLTESRLIERSSSAEGWQIVGWNERNRTREEVEDIREKRRSAGRKGGQAKAAAKQDGKQSAKQVASTTSNPEYRVQSTEDIEHSKKASDVAPDLFAGQPPGSADADPEPPAEAKKLCEELADKVAANPPGSVRPRVTAAWVSEMDRTMRIDGRTPEAVRGCMAYVFDDPDGSWWVKNIRSPQKLRKHFDGIRAQKIERDARARRQPQASDASAHWAVIVDAFRASLATDDPGAAFADAITNLPPEIQDLARDARRQLRATSETDARIQFMTAHKAARTGVPA